MYLIKAVKKLCILHHSKIFEELTQITIKP